MKILRALSASLAPVAILACTLTQSTSSLTDGVCTQAGFKACSGKCVALGDPETGCGQGTCQKCNFANAQAMCSANSCAMGACASNYKDCNGSPADGCEVNVTNDAKNCGSCGMACPTGHLCVNSNCLVVTKIASSASSNHTCAVLSDGTVRCWGSNSSGQIGAGQACSQMTCPSAQPVTGLGNVLDVATGADHTCALLKDGTVSCWGANSAGQLGLGQAGMPHNSPQAVPGMTDVKVIAAGTGYTCALKNDGSLWCWGTNDYGELALGDSNVRATPTQVGAGDAGPPFVNHAVDVVAGYRQMCVRTSSGNVSDVYCAGSNEQSQLGFGDANALSMTPTCVQNNTACSCNMFPNICSPALIKMSLSGDNAAAVTAGGDHTCVLQSDGTVWCAGLDMQGEIGDGQTTLSQPVPVQTVSSSGTFTAISAGNAFTCGILKGSTSLVACWGLNLKGEVFQGGAVQQLNTATLAPNVSGVVALTTGHGHTCVLLQGATVGCAGANDQGQLGNNMTSMLPFPTLQTVQGLP